MSCSGQPRQGPLCSESAWGPGRETLEAPRALCASDLQVNGRKYPGLEDGIQVVVVDGSQGHVLRHVSFRSAVLQAIPWQLFSYVATIPDK